MRVTIRNDELGLFKKIFENGFAVGNGSETDRLVRELKRGQIPVYHGYDREAKKVIVALEHPFEAEQKRRTLAKTLFEIRPKKAI